MEGTKTVNVTKNYYGGFKHGGEAVYGFGLIGAAVYFISTAPTFWIGALGILKAIVWPAILVYKLMQFLVL